VRGGAAACSDGEENAPAPAPEKSPVFTGSAGCRRPAARGPGAGDVADFTGKRRTPAHGHRGLAIGTPAQPRSWVLREPSGWA
jgi:hypothetical protein